MRIELADLAHRVDAAHVGHHDVHRHEIGPQLLVLLDRLDARLRLADDLESRLLQDVADHGAHEDRVVTDENRLAQESPPLRKQDLRDQRVEIEHDDRAIVDRRRRRA